MGSKWFGSSGTLRHKLLGFIFGATMSAYGCAELSRTYDAKVSPRIQGVAVATTQVAGTVAATTPPGTPLNTAAQITLAVAGAIIALDRLTSAALKSIANAAAKTQPVISPTVPPATGPPNGTS